MKKDLFLFSGLGADRRVFNSLDLDRFKPHFVPWIDPLPKETLRNYARRLSAGLPGRNPLVLGVSFGGMVAIEIAKLMPTEKVVIISSAKTRQNLPGSPLGRRLKAHNLLPTRVMMWPNEILFWLFGVQSKAERDLLRAIMADTDEKFFRWALDQIFSWDNEYIPANTIHIHGSKDRLIPFTDADYRVEGGGHLMILSKAAEINRILASVM